MKQDKSNNVFLSIIKYGLVVYTAIRSIDLVMGTMPDSIKIFAVAVVCGLDLAFLAWDDYAAHKAKSASQHTIGVVMILVNLLGIGAALMADTATVVDPAGSRELIGTVALFVIPALVIANVGTLSAIGQLDPDRKLAEEQARHDRDMAMELARHTRDLAREQQAATLEVERMAHTHRLNGLRDDYTRNQGRKAEVTTMASEGSAAVSLPKSTEVK